MDAAKLFLVVLLTMTATVVAWVSEAPRSNVILTWLVGVALPWVVFVFRRDSGTAIVVGSLALIAALRSGVALARLTPEFIVLALVVAVGGALATRFTTEYGRRKAR
jgi:cell division protein FtsW (lipid II flippase)